MIWCFFKNLLEPACAQMHVCVCVYVCVKMDIRAPTERKKMAIKAKESAPAARKSCWV